MKVVLAGGSGLIGSALIELLAARDDIQLLLPLRRVDEWCRLHPQLAADPRITPIAFDELLAESRPVDAFFCALGTTQAKSGKQGLYAVDYQLVTDCAAWARANGAQLASVVSALGADAGSRFFYNRVKGQMEQRLETLGFSRLQLWQPSLLIGERNERRSLERLAGWLLRSAVWGNLQAMPGERIARAMVAAAFSESSEYRRKVRYRVADVRRLMT